MNHLYTTNYRFNVTVLKRPIEFCFTSLQTIHNEFYLISTSTAPVSNHQQALSTFFLLNIWEVGEPCFHFSKFISLSSVDSKQNKSTYERKPSFFFQF